MNTRNQLTQGVKIALVLCCILGLAIVLALNSHAAPRRSTALINTLRIATFPDFSPTRNYASAMVAAASDPMFCYDGWVAYSQGVEGPYTVTLYRCPSTGTEINCLSINGGAEDCYCTFQCAD